MMHTFWGFTVMSFLYLRMFVCVRYLPSPSLVDVRALACGAGWGRLGERSRVQDPLGPSVHCGLATKKPLVKILQFYSSHPNGIVKSEIKKGGRDRKTHRISGLEAIPEIGILFSV